MIDERAGLAARRVRRALKLIIQIPAFNEEKNIAAALSALPRSVEGFDSVETLVIDDGSVDGTVAAARAAGATYVIRLLSHRGLATAFITGLEAALQQGADVIVNTDADNQYDARDIPALVAPIVSGRAEVVIGDRQVAQSPFMGPWKRFLQSLGSRAVGFASGIQVPDATSGMRAFSREAAYQLNVFNPFTYTLETIIQSGNKNLELVSVPVRTNAPTRPSRLYRGIGSYVRKSIVTIFRVYTIYKPLKTFAALGSVLVLAGVVIGCRFLYFYLTHQGGGHLQSLILAAVFLIIGFQTGLIGLLADLVSVNRRLEEQILIRLKKLERPGRKSRTEVQKPLSNTGAVETPSHGSQWVWVVDEHDVEQKVEAAREPAAEPRRKRRRRRRGAPAFPEHAAREPLAHHPRPPDGSREED